MSSAEKRQALLTPEEKIISSTDGSKLTHNNPPKKRSTLSLKKNTVPTSSPLPIWNQTATTATQKYERTQ
ncbi:hypothetical protein [Rothia nasimurium]|uniref:hypothetical protein n=1 Tax=Rothia nasimurium TaxID=85336 RepID=UPI001F1B582F|nr:hypothetical protein [Rothia nasimurium]